MNYDALVRAAADGAEDAVRSLLTSADRSLLTAVRMGDENTVRSALRLEHQQTLEEDGGCRAG